MRTSAIVDKLEKAELDMALLATPLENDNLLEVPIYYEKFAAYVSPKDPLFTKSEIESGSMPTEHMWVLQEGHCLRNQVLNFCHRKTVFSNIYEAGSIDTLIKIVDKNGGYTVIPEMHIPLLCAERKNCVRPLTKPEVVREISLVVRRDYVRERLLNIIADSIRKIIPEHMVNERLKKFAIKI